jgi:hypothetical protein
MFDCSRVVVVVVVSCYLTRYYGASVLPLKLMVNYLKVLHDASSDKINCGIDGCPNEVVDGVVKSSCKTGNNAVTLNALVVRLMDLLSQDFRHSNQSM